MMMKLTNYRLIQAIHGIGAICPFNIKVASNSIYTGLLKPDASVTGFIRMGGGGDIMSGNGLAPGASIKILRSGTSSANFVATKELNPLPTSFDFFSVVKSTHIPGNSQLP